MAHVITSVVRDEGPLALYRGLLPSILLVSHVALHFMFYEEVKKKLMVCCPGQRSRPLALAFSRDYFRFLMRRGVS
jgi:hypothetical protein